MIKKPDVIIERSTSKPKATQLLREQHKFKCHDYVTNNIRNVERRQSGSKPNTTSQSESQSVHHNNAFKLQCSLLSQKQTEPTHPTLVRGRGGVTRANLKHVLLHRCIGQILCAQNLEFSKQTKCREKNSSEAARYNKDFTDITKHGTKKSKQPLSRGNKGEIFREYSLRT